MVICSSCGGGGGRSICAGITKVCVHSFDVCQELQWTTMGWDFHLAITGGFCRNQIHSLRKFGLIPAKQLQISFGCAAGHVFSCMLSILQDLCAEATVTAPYI